MITKDGYATVPWGNRFVLIHNGFQISDHKTEEQAIAALKKHQKKTQGASKKTGTRSKSKAKLVIE